MNETVQPINTSPVNASIYVVSVCLYVHILSAFMLAGESKSGAIRQWRSGADIPACAIRPAAGVDVLVEARLLPANLS